MKNLFLIVSCLLLVVCLSSCGERIENTNYYYGPTWSRGGSIFYILGLQTTHKDFLGTTLSSAYYESLVTAEATGVGESFYFDVTSDPAYALNCSPANDYIAYLAELNTSLFYKIVIRNFGPGPHRGFDKIDLAFSPGIRSFDWSSDGTKLVYCSTQEVRTTKLDGTADTLVTAEANLEYVSWKYGSRIAFYHDGVLSLINEDGSGRLDLAVAASVNRPQISPTNTFEVYGIAGGAYCGVDTSATTPATTEILAAFGGQTPRLDPTGATAIYSKTAEQTGIYSLNLTTRVETKLK